MVQAAGKTAAFFFAFSLYKKSGPLQLQRP